MNQNNQNINQTQNGQNDQKERTEPNLQTVDFAKMSYTDLIALDDPGADSDSTDNHENDNHENDNHEYIAEDGTYSGRNRLNNYDCDNLHVSDDDNGVVSDVEYSVEDEIKNLNKIDSITQFYTDKTNYNYHNIANNNMNNNNIMERIIGDQITSGSSMLELKNIIITELPEILKTLDGVRVLLIENCELKSLKNLPTNLKELSLKFNVLSQITNEDVPKTIESINLSKNRIEKLDLSQCSNLKEVDLSYNPIRTFKLPQTIERLNIAFTIVNDLSDIKGLINLKYLKMPSIQVENIDELPDSIQLLVASRTLIKKITKLPKNIKEIVMHSCELREFGFASFPETLRNLDLYDNNIEVLPKLPNIMESVDVSKNKLKKVGNIPKYLERLGCSDNNDLILSDDQIKIVRTLQTSDNCVISMNDRYEETYNDYNHNEFNPWINQTNDQNEMNKRVTITESRDYNANINNQESKTNSIQQNNQENKGYVDARKLNTNNNNVYKQMYMGNMGNLEELIMPKRQLFGNTNISPSMFDGSGNLFGMNAFNSNNNNKNNDEKIMRLIQGDGFRSTKDDMRKIRQKYTYKI